MAIYAAFTIDQGTTFESIISVVDSSGLPMIITSNDKYIRAQLRKSFSSTTKVFFTCAIFDGTKGQIKISLTAAETLALKPGRYVYDVIIADNSDITLAVIRVLEGQIEVTPAVTKTPFTI